ncbi:MAG: response regulator transcription factor [Firmicutes bacterium]|jgi:DNA-binding response OmpR family regulator|nr:response regulator transcription factor [Bacillota bacterium]
MRKVLVLEDEEEIREFIMINLKRNGFEALEAGTGEDALEIAKKEKFDIAVLDVMLPGIDGFQVCKKLREDNKTMGIIMLTARTQEMDKINGLYAGADDYVTKPFSPSELVARIDALVRRIELMEVEKPKELKSGPFKLDYDGRKILKDDEEIELTQIEYSIIKLLMENEGESLSRDFILNKIWGENYVGSWKIVDVNIRRIRSKIEDDPSNPEYIKTIWGYGYRWRKED